MEASINPLINLLEANTQDLLATYLKETESWSKASYAFDTRVSKWNEVKWCEYFGVQPRKANEGTSSEFLAFPRGFYNTVDGATAVRMQAKARSAEKLGLEQYVQKDLEKANRHYKDSIIKLAERLVKKGINPNSKDIEIISGRVDVNFEVRIKAGDITVRAWTIIASGEVQRPHYRYLIK